MGDPGENGEAKALEEPLWRVEDGSGPLDGEAAAAAGARQEEEGTCSMGGAVTNLCVTAVGGGMLALPKAVASVGIGVGVVLFALVSALSHISTCIIARVAARRGAMSYGELVRAEFGPRGALILRCAIIIHVGGVMIVYLLIMGDMLVGAAPDYAGVLPTLLGRHDGVWFLSRSFVVAVLVLAVIVPMLIPRTLGSVSRFSGMSIIMVLFIAIIIVALSILAAVQGKSAHVHFWPDFSGTGADTPLQCMASLFTSISVLCLSFTCHFNLIPIQQSLKGGPEYSTMKRVIQYGIAIIAGLYAAVGVSGYAMFGEKTDGDILINLTIRYVSTLVHPTLAAVLINTIAICYAFNLCVNFVLKVWPVRENVVELVHHRLPQDLSLTAYYCWTAALTLGAYSFFVVLPSVYVLIALIGSTACCVFSFVFPACLLVKSKGTTASTAIAAGMILLSAIMAVMAVYSTLTGQGVA